MNASAARYQNFQSATAGDLITIFHAPSVEFISVDRRFPGTLLYWSFNGSVGGEMHNFKQGFFRFKLTNEPRPSGSVSMCRNRSSRS